MTGNNSSSVSVSSDLKQSSKTFENMLAGGISGVVGQVIGHPLDTMKVWLQSQKLKHEQSTFQLIKYNLERGGYSALMKGVLPSTVGRFMISGCGFTFLSGFRSALQYSSPFFQPHESVALLSGRNASPLHTTCIAAALTGVCLSIFGCPLDLIKIQMQKQHLYTHFLHPYPHEAGKHSSRNQATPLPSRSPFTSPSIASNHVLVGHTRWESSWHCSTDLVQRYGVSSLFRGFQATLIRNPLFWSVYYTSYEAFTRKFNGKTEVGYNRVSNLSSSAIVLLGGCIAGGLSWLAVMPLDYIKTKIQIQQFHVVPIYSGWRGIRDCAQATYQQFGIKKFYAGVIPTVLRGSLVNAVIFFNFELLFKYFSNFTDT